MGDRNTSSLGMQQKYYDAESSYWYKEDYLGTEGLSEYLVTLLLHSSKIPHAVYEPCTFYIGKRKVIGCRSKNFLQAGETLKTSYALFKSCKGVDIADVLAPMSVEDKIKYFVDGMIDMTGLFDFGKYMSCLLQLDAVTLNDDRHFRNICVVLDSQGSYKFAPIFDNGGALLSDKYTYGEISTEEELDEAIASVVPKPFSSDFDEQLEICERLYGSSPLQLCEIQNKDLDAVKDIYSESDINKSLVILRRAKRKYSYVFTSGKFMVEAMRNKGL